MCDPLTLGVMAASGALGAGGAKYNANIQNEAIDAQNQANRQAMEINNRAREEEAARQNMEFDRQLEQVSQTLAAANPVAQVERVQKQATSPDNPTITAAANYNSTPLQGQFQNKSIMNATAGKVDESKKRTATIADALARLTALDTVGADVDRTIQQGAGNIRTIGSNRRGSMNANAAETSIQPHKITPSRSMTGDLMLLGSQLGGGAAGQMAGGSSLGDILMARRR